MSSAALPTRYTRLLDTTIGAPREDARLWIGDVGLVVPASRGELDDWESRLRAKRWPGMHPDLLPFAADACGNRYCFARTVDDDDDTPPAIVHWMYETYRAIPVARSFEAFADWMGLTSALAAQSLDGHPDDAADHNERVVPLLAHIGVETDWLDTLGAHAGNLHSAMHALHPGSPGSAVMLAMREAALGREFSAVDLCEAALTRFGAFLGAHLGVALALSDGTDSERHFDALFEAAHLPMTYAGDELAPHFIDIPRLDPTALFESLALHPRASARIDEDPLWDMIQADDPCLADAWLRVAAQAARAGDLRQASTWVCNAVSVAVTNEEATSAMELLVEIYDAMDRPWHAEQARVDDTIRHRGDRHGRR